MRRAARSPEVEGLGLAAGWLARGGARVGVRGALRGLRGVRVRRVCLWAVFARLGSAWVSGERVGAGCPGVGEKRSSDGEARGP